MSYHMRKPGGRLSYRGPLLSPLGGTDTPFELGPEATAELKRALVALAEHGADPLTNPTDPITETVWKQIALGPDDIGSWVGPAADELVAAVSRHALLSGIDGPYLQLGGSQLGAHGIVGGPQPTAAGLEVIAGALERLLGGQPRMASYLAWRGGIFAPPSMVSAPPPSAIVRPNPRHGPAWQPSGYTPVWPQGEAKYVEAAAKLDEELVKCWRQLEALTKATEEQRRLAIEECIMPMRAMRHQAVLLANKGAPEPACPQGMAYDHQASRCKKSEGIIDLPAVTPTDEMCIAAYVADGKSEAEARALCAVAPKSILASVGGALAVGAAVGLGIWYATKTPKRARRTQWLW